MVDLIKYIILDVDRTLVDSFEPELLSFQEAMENEAKLKKGDNMIFTAFGAGFVHGASYYKWAYDGSKNA